MLPHFRRGLIAFVIPQNAEDRISKPDGAVGFDHHVIRELRRWPCQVSISTVRVPSYSVRVTRRPPCSQVISRPVPVTGVAVGKVGRLLKHTDRAGGFFPFEDAVVGNIAPQQVAPIAKPDRAFRPAAPGVQALHGGELEPVLFKAWIERGDGRIRDNVGADANRP